MTYQDNEYEIVVEKKKNKNAYIRFKDDTIYVIVPTYYTNHMIKKLISENEDSIKKMIDKVNSKKREGFWYKGVQYQVIYTSMYEDITFYKDKIYVKDEKTLERFLDKERKQLFLEHLNYWLDIFEEDIPTPKLRIRKMKTRWGVCNRSNNTVTLNAELITYDTSKLDYVIVHELSHFIHFNHSASFWNLVSKYIPDYKKIRKELR